MHGNSPRVISNQTGIHEHLGDVVRKHLCTTFLKPYHPASLELFPEIASWRDLAKPLILDSGCGTGESSLWLAERFPAAQILGVDKSAHRLDKIRRQAVIPERVKLCQADVVDIWRWLLKQGMAVDQHFILYPNPWPKSQHVQRRWHGSAVFKTLLQLGGELTLRSNWRLYVEEFQAALQIAEIDAKMTRIHPTAECALTPFEVKYIASDHELWELSATLPGRSACCA